MLTGPTHHSQAGSSSWVGSESGGGGGDCRQPGTCVLPLLAVQLVRALLRADPGQRLTAAAVLSHPWIVASQSQRFRRAVSASALRLAPKPDPEPYSLTLEVSPDQDGVIRGRCSRVDALISIHRFHYHNLNRIL